MSPPRSDHARLLKNIQDRHEELRGLFAQSSDKRGYEDPVYRFYHHSFKVFALQERTLQIVRVLQALLPNHGLASEFQEVVAQGTGKEFSIDCNSDWSRHTRPILEAFFHARFFLEMAVRYAELEDPPTVLPSGWAALLSLYRLR